ncbi:unnamed protein product [Polarella glacialis]|uniref:Calmodulin-lysine N-methyltransferase n=1 Tax=Polarella glacialis TaxID=89957 RepID=A0A813H519_POLGL|nr:unnamed protein product [Polarella glacialis]
MRVLQMNPGALPKRERGMPREVRDAVTGLRVWLASLLMCRFFERHPDIVRGKGICGLGEGIGLLGVFLATQGPSRALLTDGSPLCVSMIKANLDIADLPPELEKEAAVLPFGEMFELVDSLRGRFDVLFAADVVYNRTASVIDDLFQTAEETRTHGSSAGSSRQAWCLLGADSPRCRRWRRDGWP